VNGKVAHALGIIDLPQQRADADELDARSASATFWDDAAKAEAVLRRLSEHKATIEKAEEWLRSVDDAKVALELAPELVADETQEAVALIDEARQKLGSLASELERWEVRALMGGASINCCFSFGDLFIFAARLYSMIFPLPVRTIPTLQ
jgi:multidrug resistance efflux pump